MGIDFQLAPCIIAGLLVVTGYMFTRWLSNLGELRQWKMQARAFEALVIGMREEGCAAMGALENIFNGVTAGGMPHSKLVKKIADVATDALVMCAPCDHKEEVERLREALDNEIQDVMMLCGIASEVYDHVTGGRISKPNTLASEIISEADDRCRECVDEEVKDIKAERNAATERAQEAERLLEQAYDRLIVERSKGRIL